MSLVKGFLIFSWGGGGGYRKRPVALNGSMSWVVVRNAGFFLLKGIGGSPPTSSKFAYSPTTWKNISPSSLLPPKFYSSCTIFVLISSSL